MFGWLKKRKQRPQPESDWFVVVVQGNIRVTDHDGNEASVPTAEISGIVIETNDSGPWGADVWWLLFGADEQQTCAFPQGATGEQAALDHLMDLPGFDYEQMIAAMSSTENAVFPVWRKRE
ncbi:MAG: hypothetical protein P8J20_11860 [Novosphingobium sp.]|nr:hypothetical protein [Novosphingobium sp.]